MVRKPLMGGIVGASVLLLVLSGCGIFTTDSGRPDKARLTLDQSDSPSLEISTSLNFIVTEGQTLNFQDFSVDTVSVPFDQTYEIAQYLRFYVKATNILSEPATFRMRLTIDGESWLNEQMALDPEETAEFVYRYQEPFLY